METPSWSMECAIYWLAGSNPLLIGIHDWVLKTLAYAYLVLINVIVYKFPGHNRSWYGSILTSSQIANIISNHPRVIVDTM